MEVTIMRGETVVVRTLGGEPNILKVWEVAPDAVFLCSRENFEKLISGQQGLIPIGFPRYDVFEYDSDLANRLMEQWQHDPTLWEQLKVWEGETNGH
jgi:hypothetical protein